MPSKARKFVRVTKFLLAGVTVFCVSWIASVGEWHGGSAGGGGGSEGPTMRTIVAYSEGKLAELDRPSPVTCDSLPAFPHLPYINRTWSPGETADGGPSPWQHVPGTRVALYAAYYDARAAQKYVRILASFQGKNLEEALFCQTRPLNPYEDFVEVVAAKPLEIWWHKWDASSADVDTPLLLSCPLTEALLGPSVVSVVTQPCNDPKNAFLLEPSQRKTAYKRTFTICVKDLNFKKDVSQNLVEWIETNKVLGVDMIDIYVDNVTQSIEIILQYYRDKGFIRLFHVPHKHKPGRTLWQRRRDHIITYNECLYRNIAESEYVVPLDVDEIVLPKVASSWPELIKRLNRHGWNPAQNSAILVRNVFFFDFMQGLDENTPKRSFRNKRKVYVKRDDVRIYTSNQNLDVGEIESVNNSISNEVIDYRDIDKMMLLYKSRCGSNFPVPKLVRHIVRSAVVSPIGHYSKSLMLTRKVLTAFNHYPLASLGAAGFAGWAAPFSEVQLNHYKESCNTTILEECARYRRRARTDRSALRLRAAVTRALAAAAPCAAPQPHTINT